MEYAPLQDLQIGQKGYKIICRVGRIWDSTNALLQDQLISVDFLLVDDQRSSIEGSMTKEDAPKLRELLLQGKVYTMTNFSIGSARKSFRVCQHHGILRMDTRTIVKEVSDQALQIPQNSFNLVGLNIIKKRLHNDTLLTDVMGQLTSVGRLENIYINGRMALKKNLVLQTKDMDTINITLWGIVAKTFNGESAINIANSEPVIATLTSMTVRSFRAETTLSSTSATKIYLNLDIPEVQAFRSRICYPNEVMLIGTSADPVSNTIGDSYALHRTIEELLSLNHDAKMNKNFSCTAVIKDIDGSKGWWYNACEKCKVGITNYNGIPSCRKCGPSKNLPIPWYKVSITATDATGTAKFMMFGKHVERLVKIPASTLTDLTGSMTTEIPQAIQQIKGKTYKFTVSISDKNDHPKNINFKVLQVYPIDADKTMIIEVQDEAREETTNDHHNECTSKRTRNAYMTEDLLLKRRTKAKDKSAKKA